MDAGALNPKKSIPQFDLASEMSKTNVTIKSSPNQIDLSLESHKAQLELRYQEEKIEKLSQEWRENLTLRKRFAYIMAILVGLSNLATLVLIFLLGFKIHNFQLSDTVVVAVISATVAELASIFLIIIKYLFRV